MKRIPTEDELEVKEAKEAIKRLKKYCENHECSNCDIVICDWCYKELDSKLYPRDWVIFDGV